VRRACRGFRELRDRPAPKDRRARKVRPETKAKRAIKAIRGQRAASMFALFRLIAL
jgi:hypothetical protein